MKGYAGPEVSRPDGPAPFFRSVFRQRRNPQQKKGSFTSFFRLDMTTTRPARILFACPQTLFDVSNGASMQCYSMMQELARRGLQVASIGGGIFDNPSGVARIPNLAEQIAENKGKKLLVNKDYSAGGGG